MTTIQVTSGEFVTQFDKQILNYFQFVSVTFDDAVNVINIETYREVLYGRSNSNGCPPGATFYVSHEYTNYLLVNELYNRGYEISLHSMTHQTPQTYWAEADYDVLVKEFADQRTLMSHFALIPEQEIRGNFIVPQEL